MLLLTPLVIGVIIGILMPIIFGRPNHVGVNILAAIIGALTFRFISYFIIISERHVSSGFSKIGVISSLAGAVTVTYVMKLLPALKQPTSKKNESDKQDNKEE